MKPHFYTFSIRGLLLFIRVNNVLFQLFCLIHRHCFLIDSILYILICKNFEVKILGRS